MYQLDRFVHERIPLPLELFLHPFFLPTGRRNFPYSQENLECQQPYTNEPTGDMSEWLSAPVDQDQLFNDNISEDSNSFETSSTYLEPSLPLYSLELYQTPSLGQKCDQSLYREGGDNYSELSWRSNEPEPQSYNPHDLQSLMTPTIHAESLHENDGNKPPQYFQCTNRCRGNFLGPHQCSWNGRSLKILCLSTDGTLCSSTFKNKVRFNRHYHTIHSHNRPDAKTRALLDCPFTGCTRTGWKGFKREDNLRQHRRSVHGEYIPKVQFRFGPNSATSVTQYNGSRASAIYVR